MAPELVSLYERILTLIPVDEVQDSYNGVLQEEISPITRSVNDVSAAFAKLKEVRDAVHKLSDKSIGGHSATLTEEINTTMELQRELKRKLELVVATMSRRCSDFPASGDAQLSCKRKRSEESEEHQTKMVKTEKQSENPAQATETEEGHLELVKGGKYRTVEIVPVRGLKSGGYKLTEVNCLEVLRMMTQLSVVEREKHLSGVLSDLERIVPGREAKIKIMIMKYVIHWAHLSAGHGNNLEPFRRFHQAMKQRSKKTKGVGLKKLNDSLLDVLKNHVQESNASATKMTDESRLNIDLLVSHVTVMAPNEQKKHAPKVISALKQQMSRNASKCSVKEVGLVSKALKQVSKWAESGIQGPELRVLYGDLAEQIHSFASGVVKFVTRADLYSEMRKLKTFAGMSSNETIEVKAERVLTEVKKLKGRGSVKKVTDYLFMADEVLRHREKGWGGKHRRDIVGQLYAQLMQCCKTLPQGPCREQCEGLLQRWKQNKYLY